MHSLGILRPIRNDELDLMLEWRNAPTVRANMYTRHEITRDEHFSWWEKTKSRVDQKYFMYEFEGRPTGIVALTGIDMKNLNAVWAFYASPSAPRGTGSKMEYLALEYVFRDIKLHKLYCEVLAFNSAVIKLHQKFAFKVEGVFRDQHKFNEKFVDIYRLGILGTEWEKQREIILEKLMGKNK